MLKAYAYIYLVLISIVLCSTPSRAEATWENVEPGLDMSTFIVADDIQIVAVRFDPKFFTFSLFSISENNSAPQTLMQWAQKYNLVAAINASMYLPNGKTSTGYMRSGSHLNNKHIAKNFGAFFLSKPYNLDLPTARLIDRDTEGWQDLLEQYDVVVQNYRLIDSNRQILWSSGGQEHSIAAVAEDEAGNILFLHCREPIAAHDFASALLIPSLSVRTVMYVEGGVQAGLVLRTAKEETLWGGWHPSDILMGSVSVALPNIIGVLRK